MALPAVFLTRPSSELFTFPPSDEPITVPAPQPGSSLSAPPFAIPSSWYTSVLDIRVPVTIALTYAVTVSALNRYNRSRGNKPWAISKTRPFFWFVILHNVFLAVYSAWTFVGMFGALQRTLESWSSPAGLAGTLDSLCKIHGASGLGNAVTYNPPASSWISQSPSTVTLNEMGTPAATDMGRLWNEGLAFYGWFFYLSKFYEVLDTVIILAKGKRSSTLQTYHHSGAMMCMWAGIRYMSPPIWMFVFVNSGIHAMMYTYYTLTAFSVPIPRSLKQSLTTMQIIQFLVGVTFAAVHSFVSYRIPTEFSEAITTPSVAATASTTAAIANATSATLSEVVKKYLFRAAGEEGLAENVHGKHLPTQNATHMGSWQQAPGYKTVSCIDTSGQTFAIWLNVIYLAPLTALFMRFFVKSYLRRTTSQLTSSTAVAKLKGKRASKKA